ncbi:MAG: YbaB/EbfC family nucleoid-associated protein [Termitinemataceae bacterium]|nr:MAG: YbaB/EbfC family nucleoid-associated protein [Termitinemataceae bacterium]
MNINPFDLLKNAQKIQEQMGSMQEKLAEVVVTGSAGGGMVEIDLNGKSEMTDIRILPEAASDIAMMQDLILAAYTCAQEKLKDAVKDTMGSFAQGLGLPSIPGFPC